jgi:hypothetical protein
VADLRERTTVKVEEITEEAVVIPQHLSLLLRGAALVERISVTALRTMRKTTKNPLKRSLTAFFCLS